MSFKRLSILFCSHNGLAKGPVYRWFEETDAQVLWVDSIDFATAMLECFSVDAVVVPKTLDVGAFHKISPKTPVFIDAGDPKHVFQQIQRVLWPESAPLDLEVTAAGQNRKSFEEETQNALPDAPAIPWTSEPKSELDP
jgi:hypothetical protein